MEDFTELLKNFDIKFVRDVNELLKCTICKNILVDACFSPCMCRFCWDCIDQHLRDGSRPCPGGKDECSETILNSVNELQKDEATNKQISFLLAECPNENCDHRCQLRKIPEHMRTCGKSAVECVFSYVGCVDELVAYDKMKEHLDDRTVEHGRSFVAHIRKMENEMKERMDRYEMVLASLTTENAVLRQIGERNSMDIERMKEEIGLLSSKEERLTLENAALKGEIQSSREDVTVLRQRLDECENRQIAAENKMRQILEGNAVEMKEMEKEIGDFLLKAENEKSDWRIAERDFIGKIEKHREGTVAFRQMQGNFVSKLDKLAAVVTGQDGFVWRIEGISGKLDNNVEISDPFYSDGTRGYKLRLGYRMSLSRGLLLKFCLIPGDDDDRLQWPMCRTVLIEIIDEQSKVPIMSRLVCRATVAERVEKLIDLFLSENVISNNVESNNSDKDKSNNSDNDDSDSSDSDESDDSDNIESLNSDIVKSAINDRLKTAYDRPTNDNNKVGDGFIRCVKYEQIESMEGAIRNDSMTVRCRVLPH